MKLHIMRSTCISTNNYTEGKDCDSAWQQSVITERLSSKEQKLQFVLYATSIHDRLLNDKLITRVI